MIKYRNYIRNNKTYPIIFTHTKEMTNAICDEFISSVVNYNIISNLMTEIEENSTQVFSINEGSILITQSEMTLEQFNIEKVRSEKLASLATFWNTTARLMTFKTQNSQYQQNLIANQDFINNIKSVITQTAENAIYQYILRDNNNKVVFNNSNESIFIPMSYNALQSIKSTVEVRRSYCANSYAIQEGKLTRITSLEDINNFDIQKDLNNQNYVPSTMIILDNNGNIVV